MKLKFTIGRRLGLGFGAILFFTIVAFLFTLKTLNESKKKVDQITVVYIPSVNYLKELNSLVLRSKILITNWVYTQNQDPSKDSLKGLLSNNYPRLKEQIHTISAKWDAAEQDSMQIIFSNIDDLFNKNKAIMMSLNSFESYDDAETSFLTKNSVQDQSGDIYVQTEIDRKSVV